MATRRKRKTISALFSRSKICNLFSKTASFLFCKAESSITGKLLSSYNDKMHENGLIYSAINELNLQKKLFRPVKRNISKYTSQSLLLNKLNNYLNGFLFTKLNVYGLSAITAGFGFILVEILKIYTGKSSGISFLNMFVSALLCLLAIPLLFSSSTLSSAVCASKNASAFVFEWLGCKRTDFEVKETAKGHSSKTALPLAVIFSIASWWARPHEILLAIALFVIALAIFYSPETGVVLLCFVLPFLAWEKLFWLVAYISICFLLKYIRGKRTIVFDTLGIVVLLFGLIVWFSYHNGEHTQISRDMTKQFLLGICTFFLVVNLIKSKQWIRRCVSSVSAACFVVALFGIVSYLVYILEIPYFTEIFSKFVAVSGLSYFLNIMSLAQYLVVAIPFVVLLNNKNSRLEVLSDLVVGLFAIICLGITGIVNAFVCLVAGVAFFLMMNNKKSLSFLLFMMFMTPIAFVLIPTHILDKSQILFEITSRIKNGILFLTDTFKTGVPWFVGNGMGTFDGYSLGTPSFVSRFVIEFGVIGFAVLAIVLLLSFVKNTTMYAKGCSENGKRTSLAVLSSLIGLLLMGQEGNIFFDYKITFMFWLCLGFSSCVSGTERQREGMTAEMEYAEFFENDLL